MERKFDGLCPLQVEGWCPENHCAKFSDFSDIDCKGIKDIDEDVIMKCWELYDMDK